MAIVFPLPGDFNCRVYGKAYRPIFCRGPYTYPEGLSDTAFSLFDSKEDKCR
jgi:hypothetical protein